MHRSHEPLVPLSWGNTTKKICPRKNLGSFRHTLRREQKNVLFQAYLQTGVPLRQPNRFPQAILPVKKALGGDPEVAEARESLTKYKAKLSTAVAEAAAAASTRCVCASYIDCPAVCPTCSIFCFFMKACALATHARIRCLLAVAQPTHRCQS